MTPYQLHMANWQNCTRCELCHGRKRIVFARGTVPCDVLFIGQSPGKNEDALGLPFVGQSGDKLDWIIKHSVAYFNLRWAMTNLVACKPRAGEKPDPESVDACAPRLQEFVRIADPKLIITVGVDARDCLDWRYHGTVRFHRQIPQEFILHPSFILRQSRAQQGVLFQQAAVAVMNAIDEYGVAEPQAD